MAYAYIVSIQRTQRGCDDEGRHSRHIRSGRWSWRSARSTGPRSAPATCWSRSVRRPSTSATSSASSARRCSRAWSTGLRRPRYGVPGFDVAGVVEAVGPDVTRFRRRRRGLRPDATARPPSSREPPRMALAPKPAGLSFEEAAAIPTSASAALHGLRDAGKLRAGQRVLVIGASGGVGTFEIQIAKAMGAEVTAVAEHQERGAAPLDRRGPRDRLHAGRLRDRRRPRSTSSSTTSRTVRCRTCGARWPRTARSS